MTELSSVSGLRGVREALEKLYHAVSGVGFGHDTKAQKQRLADALEEAGTVLAETAALSLPPSPQARNQDYKSDLHADLRDFDQAVAYVRACAIEGALDIALRDVLEAHGVTAPAGAQGQVQGVQRERKVGNRFVIRNNDLVKIATGEAIPEWEPLFLFRARDYLALPALLRLREAYVQDGCTEYLMKLMDETIEAFRKFQIEHPEWMKQPGVTQGKVFVPPADVSSQAGQAPSESGTMELLRDANDKLRSAYQIAARQGVDTNWESFKNRVHESLVRQQKILFPQ